MIKIFQMITNDSVSYMSTIEKKHVKILENF